MSRDISTLYSQGNDMRTIWIIVAVIASTVLGILSNIIAAKLQPSLEKRNRRLISLFIGLLLLTISATLLSNEFSAASPSTFTYSVRVQAQKTGASLGNINVAIFVPDKAPLRGVTDSQGFAEIVVDESYVGQRGQLHIEGTGYTVQDLTVNLEKGRLPDRILLQSLSTTLEEPSSPPTIITQATSAPVPSSPPPMLATTALQTENLSSPEASCPKMITFGISIRCAIDANNEFHVYTLTANMNDVILISMARLSGNLEPKFEVHHQDESSIGTQVVSCSLSQSYIAKTTCTLPIGGTYTITASDGNGGHLGMYQLYLQRLNNPGNTSPITPANRVTGTIGTIAQFTTYIFKATEGAQIHITMSHDSGTLEPLFVLYQPNGTEVDGCNVGGGGNADGSCTAPITGTYTLLVSDNLGNKVGVYTVHLSVK